MTSDTCLFCKIVARSVPVEKIYEDGHALAFLDINPVNIGHTIVIPKKHTTNLYETEDATLGHLAIVTKKLSIAIKKAISADGINIEMNNDSIAGQLIFHTHIHIVPRFANDGFSHWHGRRPYHDGEMQKVGEKIKKKLI